MFSINSCSFVFLQLQEWTCAKMTDFKINCGPCSRKKNCSVAYKRCEDCDDYFCLTCHRNHGTFKPLLQHKVVDYDEEKHDKIALSSTESCSLHDNGRFEHFCITHNRLCCKLCVKGRHKTCREIHSIEAVADGFKRSSLNQQFQKDLNVTRVGLSAVLKQFEKDRAKLDKISRHIEKQVKYFKSEIMKHISNLEKDMLTEIESTFSKLAPTIERYKNGTNLCITTINEIDDKYELAAKLDSDSETFRLVKYFHDNILPNIHSFLDKTKEFELPVIEFNRSDIMFKMESMGKIRISHKFDHPTERYKYTPPQKQIYVPRKLKFEKTFILEKTFPYTSSEITGMGVTRDDRLILCNRAESSLWLCSQDLQDRSDIRLIGTPWAIAVESDIDEGWVTIPEENSIQRVEFPSMAADKPLGVASGCFGIALVGDNIALGRWGEVQIINREGVCLKCLDVGKSTIHCLLLGANWSLFCCEGDEGRLHCIRVQNGTTKFSYKTDEFKWPVSVVTDIHDNLYILGLKSHNLHRTESNGKFRDELLNESDDLDFPRCMTFNKNYSKLFVSNNLGKSVSVYTCKYV